MTTVKKLTTYLVTFVSLVTALGVFMHDGRVDRAVMTRLHRPFTSSVATDELAVRYKAFVETDAHTHPDHNAARSSLLNSFMYQSPSVPPRNQEQKKHLMQECQPRGHHAFDNYNLPIVA